MSISFAFYFLFDMLRREHLSFIVYLFLYLSFIVSFVFLVILEMMKEECNEIAFECWTYDNMNLQRLIILTLGLAMVTCDLD